MDQKLWAKNCNFGHSEGIFDPFDPLGLRNQIFLRVYSNKHMCISTLFNFLESFRKIKWMDQKLWGKICNFGHFVGIFDPFDPLGLTNQIFPRVKSTQYMCISILSNYLASFRKT